MREEEKCLEIINETINQDLNCHKILFSGSSQNLGKFHWYLQKAANDIEQSKLKDDIQSVMETSFTYNTDEIHWWIFNKEKNHSELFSEIEKIEKEVQKLKEASYNMKTRYNRENYCDLIQTIKHFSDSYKDEIQCLTDFAHKIFTKSKLAPIILFSYREWGSTRRRWLKIKPKSESVDLEEKNLIDQCTESASGLRMGNGYWISKVYADLLDDGIDRFYVDGTIDTNAILDKLYLRTYFTIIDNLAIYFEKVRDAVLAVKNNLAYYIENYLSLIYNENFWKSVINKIIKSSKTEQQYWDVKESLEMWHVPRGKKGEAKIKFANQLTAFANADGGVIIVGITNKVPREIVDVEDRENKIRDILNTIINYTTRSNRDFVVINEVKIEKKHANCLVIVIKQTKEEIGVKKLDGSYLYPVRVGPGKNYENPFEIKVRKHNIERDNFRFLEKIKEFIKE